MTRDLAQLDSDLTAFKAATGANIARIDTGIATTSIIQHFNSFTQQLHYAEFGKLKKAYDDFQTTQNEKWKNITGGLTGVALGFTVLTGALTVFKIDIALFKVDEHGVTILGVTREWPWKKLTERIQKAIWTKDQKTDQENRVLVNENREQIRRLKETENTVKAIKDRLTAAGAASTEERNRLQADPKKRTDRGIDANRPIVRGVASDVSILRAALNELTAAF